MITNLKKATMRELKLDGYFSSHTANHLARAGIKNVEELQKVPDFKLMNIRGIGRVSMSEIHSLLDLIQEQEENKDVQLENEVEETEEHSVYLDSAVEETEEHSVYLGSAPKVRFVRTIEIITGDIVYINLADVFKIRRSERDERADIIELKDGSIYECQSADNCFDKLKACIYEI